MERPIVRRKIPRILFWLLIIYTALSTTAVLAIQFGLIQMPSRNLETAEQAPRESDRVMISELAFAEQFVREYLFWTQGNEDSRAARLKPFWKPNMDVQGGLDFKQVEWNSYARNVDAWSVKEREDQSGVIEVTVYAETILSHVKNSNEQKRVDRYLVVPIKKAGDSYLVAGFPRFIAPPVAKMPAEQEEDRKDVQGEAVDSQTRLEVEQFMKSFWKVYTTGAPEEIAYFKKNSKSVSGLTGMMSFLEMDQLNVRQNQGVYVAECNVLLEDLASGAKFTNHYLFKLVKEGGRWYVSSMEQGEI
ncbi:conjugal transfer protein [Thermoactinomyces mirandus]|uniref:Conjugal transfer protein n=1 Tax=Thermoactinomyces mirandus TaxID=2756294 RepID=A0A7W1XVI3_9BACL|nr:conjugal transfer protein [Thermoactinomyces mirandus]MBA4603775.1 conjugal transfer protein [Thermoactinomyces mirandus]